MWLRRTTLLGNVTESHDSSGLGDRRVRGGRKEFSSAHVRFEQPAPGFSAVVRQRDGSPFPPLASQTPTLAGMENFPKVKEIALAKSRPDSHSEPFLFSAFFFLPPFSFSKLCPVINNCFNLLH